MNTIKRVLASKKFWLCFSATVIALLVVLAEAGYLIYSILRQRSITDAPTESFFCDLSIYDLTVSSKNVRSATDTQDAVSIVCGGETIYSDNNAVTLSDQALCITAGGKYILSGNLQDRYILVEADENTKVHLILDGLTVDNRNGPAMYLRSGDKITVTLTEGSENRLTDGENYTYTDGNTDVDAAIFSKSDLVLNGTGSLSVIGHNGHGIVSKDDLILADGNYTVKSAKTGICGKDRVKVYDGVQLKIDAGSDGIRSDNSEDTERGYIDLKAADIDIICQRDGLQAEKIVFIDGTDLSVISGNGSTHSAAESSKGIKAVLDIVIANGNLHIDAADDAIHTDASFHLQAGSLQLSAADDGIHAENAILVDNGNLTVETAYEGLEGKYITVNDGKLHLCTLDDGINATAGSLPAFMEEISEMLSFQNGRLEINGGFLYVDSEGDGLDSNGILTVSGGTVLVAGPESRGNEALDCDGEKILRGGTLMLLGNAGRADNFTAAENQAAFLVSVASQEAGTTLAVCDDSGMILASFTCPKAFCDVLISTPEILPNRTYQLVTNPAIPTDLPYGFAHGIPSENGNVLQTITPDNWLFGEISGGKRRK